MKKITKHTKVKRPQAGKQSILQRSLTVKQFLLLCYAPLTATALLLVGAGMLVIDYYRPNLEDPSVIRHYIVEAVEGLSNEAPIVPTNDRQYLPEMKLSFNHDKAKIMYFYNEKTEYSQEYATITSAAIKRGSSVKLYGFQNSKDLLAAIPDYQHCQRPLILTTSDLAPENYANYQKIETLPLGSRTVYVWKTDEHLCDSAEGANYDELLETVKSAQSY